MPIYEYTCPDCQTSFEKRVSMSARQSPQDCPTCSGQARRIEISRFAVGGAGAGAGGGFDGSALSDFSAASGGGPGGACCGGVCGGHGTN